MKWEKINNNIIKRMYKEEKVIYHNDGNFTAVMNKNYTSAVVIPNCFLYVDMSKSKYNVIDEVIDKYLETVEDIKTNKYKLTLNYIKKINVSGKEVDAAVFHSNEMDFNVYIDTNLLKDFSTTDCEFYGTSKTGVVSIIENNILVGVVCPTRIADNMSA